ncbi:hypothetical protein U1Q18_035454 [Sarracenia purpurea var. burkii]
MFHEEPCNDHYPVDFREANVCNQLVLVQFWCSYSTVPLNVLITQMGSKCKKAVIAESVRESLHSWCKRVKEKSRRDALHSVTTRSTCSLESLIDEKDEIITVGSGTLSRCSSAGSLDQAEVNLTSTELPEIFFETPNPLEQHEFSFRIVENPSNSSSNSGSLETLANGEQDNLHVGSEVETLLELFQKI